MKRKCTNVITSKVDTVEIKSGQCTGKEQKLPQIKPKMKEEQNVGQYQSTLDINTNDVFILCSDMSAMAHMLR